jgi:hypothetical protein
VSLPDQIRNVLPADTAMAWELLASTIPAPAYLAGGTAIAVHHRTARRTLGGGGLQLFLARFQPPYPQEALGHIVRGLGYFDDVEPDDQLPVSRQTIVDYWTSRHPRVIAALGRIPP